MNQKKEAVDLADFNGKVFNKVMKLLIPLILIFSACSSDRKAILDAWKGRDIQELEQHPVFSHLPFKKKKLNETSEERNYQEQGKYRTSASCQSMGGCMGLSSGACQNIFTIKDGVIQKYQMKEACITDKTKLPTSTK